MKSEYHLFVCDTSGNHEPVAVFTSQTPFPTVAVGQRFDDHGWHRLRGVGVIASETQPIRYVVHSIKTVIRIENGINIIQTAINLTPYTGDRSPAFGNSSPTLSMIDALNEHRLRQDEDSI